MRIDPTTDILTFESFCESASSYLGDDSGQYLLISLNLDAFKTINSLYGYQKGNILLHDIADFFQNNITNILLSCRKNADQFIFLIDLTGLDISSITASVEKLYITFSTYIQENYPLAAGVSFHAGGYYISKGEKDLISILENAEIARISMKDSDRQHIVYYHEYLNNTFLPEQEILSLFDYVAEEKRLVLYLQPKFDLVSKQVIGAEALARIRNHDGLIIAPSNFIPVLEKYGIVYQLDLMILESTLKLLSQWLEQNLTPVPISINLSKLDFYSTEFIKIANEMLTRYHVPKKYLEFEISETLFKPERDIMIERVNVLHNQGYAFNIDDFGKCDTSVFSMGTLPIDAVKLDHTMVAQNLKTPKGRSILSKTFEMFSEIGLQTICEGIEVNDEAELLASCGCQFVQGYLYDKPMPIDYFFKKYIEYRSDDSYLYPSAYSHF